MATTAPTILETLKAVLTLADAGVSDEALGKAVREWLRAQRAETAVEGAKAALLEERSRGTGTDPQTPQNSPTASVTEALQASPSPASTESVLIKVQVDGKQPTTVKIPGGLWKSFVAIPSLGTESAARARVREIAKKAPPAESLTVWMKQQLSELLGQR